MRFFREIEKALVHVLFSRDPKGSATVALPFGSRLNRIRPGNAVAPVVFALVILLGLSLAAGATTQPSESELNLPSFGIRVTPPPKWVRAAEPGSGAYFLWADLPDPQVIRPDDVTHVIAVRWVTIDSKRHIQGTLQLDICRLSVPKLNEYAGLVAAQANLMPTQTATKLGGLDAQEVARDPFRDPPQRARPYLRRIRIARRGMYYVALEYAASAGNDFSDAFEALAQNVQWTDLSDPSECIVARKHSPVAQLLFDTGLAFTMPDPYRESIDGKSVRTDVIFDLVKFRMEATAKAVLLPVPTGTSLLDLAKGIELEARKLGWQKEVTWMQLPGQIPIMYSQLLWFTGDHPPTQYLLALTGPNSSVLWTFRYPIQELAEKLSAGVPLLAQSIRPTRLYHRNLSQPTTNPLEK